MRKKKSSKMQKSKGVEQSGSLISRRQFLKSVGAASVGSSALFGRTPWVFAQSEKFKIGGVLTFTGSFAPLGVGMRNGVLLAIKDVGGKILGREIELMWADDEMKTMVSVEKTKKFIADKANLIYGAVSSACTFAISDLCRSNKVLQLSTISTMPDITKKGHRYIFRTSIHQDAENYTTAKAVKNKGFKSVYLFCHDYKVSRDAMAFFSDFFKENGIKVLGAVAYPLTQTEFSVYIHKAMESQAEAICILATGAANVNFIKQAAHFDLHKKAFIFGAVLLDDNDAAALGDIGLGMETSVRYSWNHDIPTNRIFVEKFKKEYGRVPTAWEGEAYDGMMWFLKIVRQTDSMDVEKWVEAFEKSTYPESIKGPRIMRECDHQALQSGLWARVVKTPDVPFHYLKVVNSLPQEEIFEACPKDPKDWPSRRT